MTDSVPRNHRPVDIPRSADTMREALMLSTCCANHAAEISLVAAISFAADVAKNDPAEMRRYIRDLTEHIFRAIDSGAIRFTRER